MSEESVKKRTVKRQQMKKACLKVEEAIKFYKTKRAVLREYIIEAIIKFIETEGGLSFNEMEGCISNVLRNHFTPSSHVVELKSTRYSDYDSPNSQDGNLSPEVD